MFWNKKSKVITSPYMINDVRFLNIDNHNYMYLGHIDEDLEIGYSCANFLYATTSCVRIIASLPISDKLLNTTKKMVLDDFYKMAISANLGQSKNMQYSLDNLVTDYNARVL
jgi:hypothetical protein